MDREQPNSRFFKDTSHLPGPIPSPSGQAVSGSRPCCSLDECSFSESLCKNVLSRVCHSVCDLFFKAERTKVKTRVLMGKQIASPDSTSLFPHRQWDVFGWAIFSSRAVHCFVVLCFNSQLPLCGRLQV